MNSAEAAGAAGTTGGGPKMDVTDRDAALAALLARHPDGYLGAVSPQGLFVPVSEELRASGLRLIDGPSSALGLMVGDDHVTAVQAWHRVVADGVANCLFRPRSSPQVTARLHLIDTMHRFGAYTCCITGLEGTPDVLGLDAVRPRIITLRKDQTAVIVEADPAVVKVLGWTAEELAGRRSLDLVHPGDHERAIAAWMHLLDVPAGQAHRVRLRHLHRDGRTLWFEVTNHSYLSDPARQYVHAEMLDISEEVAAEEALRASEQLLRRLTEALPMGVLQIDADRRVVYQNERAARAMRLTVGEVLAESHLESVVPGDRAAVAEALLRVLRDGGDVDVEYGFRDSQLDLRRAEGKLRALDAGGAIICLADVTDAVRMREELHQRATFDALTGCRNRAATLTALQEILDEPGARRGVAVVFVDLNDFKQVNDRYGHAAGDRLLTHVAARLRAAVRDGDVVGRFGGDEFVVVCRDVAGAPQAQRLAASLAGALGRDRLDLGEVRLQPRASVGVTWARPGDTDADALIARADAAMYEAKKGLSGRSSLRR